SKYDRLIAEAKRSAAAKAIVVHPCDETSLRGAVEAAAMGLISATLVGPAAKINNVAREHNLDIGKCELVDAAHSDAAASKAVELIRAGQGELLMKGSLHTDELMRPVTASATGLRTERRISHVVIMDVPTYPETLFITDAAVNIFPDLDAKRDIVQNAIDLFTQIGLGKPRVAILSAVETVTTKIHRRSTRLPSARWRTAGKSLERSSTVHSRLTTQSIPRRPGLRVFIPQVPAGRRSWSCRISRPATCWQKISSICQKRTPPGWYSVRACPSSLHRVPTPFAAVWRRVPPPCFMPRHVANPRASRPHEPHGRYSGRQRGLLECQVSDI